MRKKIADLEKAFALEVIGMGFLPRRIDRGDLEDIRQITNIMSDKLDAKSCGLLADISQEKFLLVKDNIINTLKATKKKLSVRESKVSKTNDHSSSPYVDELKNLLGILNQRLKEIKEIEESL